MSSFTVFEEPESAPRPDFGCQTEEIATEEQTTQTHEKTLENDENLKNSPENSEILYFETVVANYKAEINRFKKINDKMEREKTAKMLELEHKKAEYNRLFEIGTEKLSKEGAESEPEPEKEEEEPEDCK